MNRPDKISAADISAICQEVSPNRRFAAVQSNPMCNHVVFKQLIFTAMY